MLLLISRKKKLVRESFHGRLITVMFLFPMQVIAIFFLWQTTGPASMAGIAVLVVLAPINGGILVSVYTKYQVGTKRDTKQHLYRPQGKVMFSEESVSHSVHRGVCPTLSSIGTLPGGRPPPEADPQRQTSQRQTPR